MLSELDREIEIQETVHFDGLHYLRSSTRRLVDSLQLQLQKEGRVHRFSDSERLLLKALEQDLQAINVELSALFNPHVS